MVFSLKPISFLYLMGREFLLIYEGGFPWMIPSQF